METLCYGIAHDLKAPIRGIQGFIGLLTSDYHDAFDADARMYAKRCQLALQHMSSLIEAILAYGRLNHTVPELIPINLPNVIDRVLNNLEAEIAAKQAKIDIQMTFPRLMGNPYLLEQVFTNLIGNALKFVPVGARPEISISATQIERPMGSTGDAPVPGGGSPTVSESSTHPFIHANRPRHRHRHQQRHRHRPRSHATPVRDVPEIPSPRGIRRHRHRPRRRQTRRRTHERPRRRLLRAQSRQLLLDRTARGFVNQRRVHAPFCLVFLSPSLQE